MRPFLPVSLAKIKIVYNSQWAGEYRVRGSITVGNGNDTASWEGTFGKLLSFKTHNLLTCQFYFYEFQRQCLQKFKKTKI